MVVGEKATPHRSGSTIWIIFVPGPLGRTRSQTIGSEAFIFFVAFFLVSLSVIYDSVLIQSLLPIETKELRKEFRRSHSGMGLAQI
jgi:hypothetical protein